MKTLPIILLLLLCEGCATTSTVTPDAITSREASYDATTPKEYPALNSGFLFFTTDAQGQFDGIVITEGGRDAYVSLVRNYAIQYKSEHGLDLLKNNGVKAFEDQYHNQLWWIHNQHLTAFQIMLSWMRARRDPDSLWQRAKERITPL